MSIATRSEMIVLCLVDAARVGAALVLVYLLAAGRPLEAVVPLAFIIGGAFAFGRWAVAVPGTIIRMFLRSWIYRRKLQARVEEGHSDNVVGPLLRAVASPMQGAQNLAGRVAWLMYPYAKSFLSVQRRAGEPLIGIMYGDATTATFSIFTAMEVFLALEALGEEHAPESLLNCVREVLHGPYHLADGLAFLVYVEDQNFKLVRLSNSVDLSYTIEEIN